jgi:hypothetical protein
MQPLASMMVCLAAEYAVSTFLTASCILSMTSSLVISRGTLALYHLGHLAHRQRASGSFGTQCRDTCLVNFLDDLVDNQFRGLSASVEA